MINISYFSSNSYIKGNFILFMNKILPFIKSTLHIIIIYNNLRNLRMEFRIYKYN